MSLMASNIHSATPSSSDRLLAYLQRRKERVEAALSCYLPETEAAASRLEAAMRYAVLEGGGKRLRPLLCIAAAEACGGELEAVLPTACALELIHCFSLVHDDLPAMDNDTLRRGRPTCHVQFGEAIALLSGDALLVHAFGLIAQQAHLCPPQCVVEVLELIATAAGRHGMAGGQTEDLLAENGDWDASTLDYIHTRKTGALIRASVVAGGLLAGGGGEALRALEIYGASLGHLFQMTDDILNEIGDPVVLGKPVGSDRARQKATYPRLIGLQGAREAAEQTLETALDALEPMDSRADPLRWIARYTLHRDR
jgi:geranylgeranyl diphosphate synthase, type II